jgi:hypothetical protein
MIKVGRYKFLKNNLNNFNLDIKPFIPSPTDSDYKKGYITRYFVQKANDSNGLIYEVSNESYKTYIKNKLLISESVDWRIIGEDSEIKNSNSESIRLASKKIPKLSLYLPNLLQFRKK